MVRRGDLSTGSRAGQRCDPVAKQRSSRRANDAPAADLDAELVRIGALNVDGLRGLWRERRGEEAPAALSKDLLARALSYMLQEKHLGRLDPASRKLLGGFGKPSAAPTRWLKVGSIIVREHAGVIHEVMVTPDGFCWRGETFTSLSTIALRITGTVWNGTRFFGLRGEARPATSGEGASP